MNYTTKKKLEIYTTLDSSEATMFTKGGMHKITLLSPEDSLNISLFDEIEISFQLARNSQGMFDHTYGEAMKHRAQWDKINEEEKK